MKREEENLIVYLWECLCDMNQRLQYIEKGLSQLRTEIDKNNTQIKHDEFIDSVCNKHLGKRFEVQCTICKTIYGPRTWSANEASDSIESLSECIKCGADIECFEVIDCLLGKSLVD
jgi:hypothetical protein